MKYCAIASVIVFALVSAAVPVAAHCQIPCGIYDDELRVQLIEEHIGTVEKSMKMIVELGEAARSGLADPRVRIAPFVEVLLELRESARRERRFEDADRIRDRLLAAGIEVSDTRDGVEWALRP